MHWVLQFFIRHRTLTSLLLTVSLSVWMIGSSPAQQMRTARFLTLYVFFPVQWTVDITGHIRNIFAENERLRRRLAELNTRVALLEEQCAQDKRVRTLVEFAETTSYELVPVRVVARDPSAVLRSLVISSGTLQGVERYMPVVDGYGVVGRVIQAMPHVSLVQLLSDPLSRTSVITRNRRVVGILEGGSEDGVLMRYRSDESVEPGDTVCTSGLGGTFPKGLYVGVVEEIIRGEDPLFNRARVALFVDPTRVEEAFVMKLSPQWAAFRSELDSLAGRER